VLDAELEVQDNAHVTACTLSSFEQAFLHCKADCNAVTIALQVRS
jgi:hypothetical protein